MVVLNKTGEEGVLVDELACKHNELQAHSIANICKGDCSSRFTPGLELPHEHLLDRPNTQEEVLNALRFVQSQQSLVSAHKACEGPG